MCGHRAEAAVARHLKFLADRMVSAKPKPLADAAEIALQAEIRAHVARQASPESFARTASDPRVLQAITAAPAFLSGLTDEQVGRLRSQAEATLHPEQVAAKTQISDAIEWLRKGRAVTELMILERCGATKMRDGTLRPLGGGGAEPPRAVA